MMRLAVNGVPTLETDRLILRALGLKDFDAYAQMWGDERVVKHISGVPLTRAESWQKLMSTMGSWPLIGLGYWAVVEKSTGRYTGQVGFADMMRGLTPSIDGRPEAGWLIAPWAQGMGYATEAMGAAMAWGLPLFGDVKPVCIMDPEYPATIRVAQKCGFVELARTTFKGAPCLMMEYQGTYAK